jgi:hypothetical protein
MSKSDRISEHAKTDIGSILDVIGEPAVAITPDHKFLTANLAYRESYGDGRPLPNRPCLSVAIVICLGHVAAPWDW